MRMIDLFCGLGGFHVGSQSAGLTCVFASEIDHELRELYACNHGIYPAGDIKKVPAQEIPDHELLCAGFPCQPFSKSGGQKGFQDSRGSLFFDILRIIRTKRPRYILLENVANLKGHDNGRTLATMVGYLEEEGYDVTSKILSPDMFGVPQGRKRLFIWACTDKIHGLWPMDECVQTDIRSILCRNPETKKGLQDTERQALTAWGSFLRRIPVDPVCPLWGSEMGATYPLVRGGDLLEWRSYRGSFGSSLFYLLKEDIVKNIPTYSITGDTPIWKSKIIQKNREFYSQHQDAFSFLIPNIRSLPLSYQKLEWNCKGEKRVLTDKMVQFRPSGIRVSRSNRSPCIVSMTPKQIPYLTWEGRYLTVRECARLQSLGSLSFLPNTETKAIKAVGNAVNAKVVSKILQSFLL